MTNQQAKMISFSIASIAAAILMASAVVAPKKDGYAWFSIALGTGLFITYGASLNSAIHRLKD